MLSLSRPRFTFFSYFCSAACAAGSAAHQAQRAHAGMAVRTEPVWHWLRSVPAARQRSAGQTRGHLQHQPPALRSLPARARSPPPVQVGASMRTHQHPTAECETCTTRRTTPHQPERRPAL